MKPTGPARAYFSSSNTSYPHTDFIFILSNITNIFYSFGHLSLLYIVL